MAKLSRAGMAYRAAIAPPPAPVAAPSPPKLSSAGMAYRATQIVPLSQTASPVARRTQTATVDQTFAPEVSKAAIDEAAATFRTRLATQAQAKVEAKSQAAQVSALQAQYQQEGRPPPQPSAGYPSQSSQQEEPPQPEEYEQQTQEVPDYREQVEAAPERVRVADWENDIPWQQEQGFAGEGPLKAISYVKDGQLCTIGMCATPSGLIPVSDKRRVPRGTPEGPVNIGSEGLALSLFGKAQVEAQKDAAGNLVRRARNGDQNAMAILKAIGENAKGGNRKARTAMQAVKHYIDSNPPSEKGEFFGTEPEKSDGLMSACVMLANGPPLSPQLIERFASSFGSEDETKLFIYGVVNCNHEGLNALVNKLGAAGKVADFGRKVGKARGLQIARTKTGPIAAFSSDAAWELGE